MKARGPKSNLPGRHQVFRGAGGDVIGLVDEELPGRPLLEPVLPAGPASGRTGRSRRRATGPREVAALPEGVRALRDPDTLPPRLSARLRALEEDLR